MGVKRDSVAIGIVTFHLLMTATGLLQDKQCGHCRPSTRRALKSMSMDAKERTLPRCCRFSKKEDIPRPSNGSQRASARHSADVFQVCEAEVFGWNRLTSEERQAIAARSASASTFEMGTTGSQAHPNQHTPTPRTLHHGERRTQPEACATSAVSPAASAQLLQETSSASNHSARPIRNTGISSDGINIRTTCQRKRPRHSRSNPSPGPRDRPPRPNKPRSTQSIRCLETPTDAAMVSSSIQSASAGRSHQAGAEAQCAIVDAVELEDS